ncbi:MAG: type II secretion system protein [Campylobacterales bacterium]|nr:type II secretion system protein [Campylobacterales bacterium]
MKRYAFTMIELIFAIVVIGISVISLPTMMGAVNKSIEENLVQEAIFAASAEMMGANSGYWDEASMKDINLSHLSRVVDINNSCDASKLRAGHINQPFHRRCLEDSNSSTPLSQTSDADIYSLDDASKSNENIFIDTAVAQASGYKNLYKVDVDVSLNSDKNIKTITTTIKDSDGNTITSLKSQNANIGEIEFYKRTM